jgi:hypothetical protein
MLIRLLFFCLLLAGDVFSLEASGEEQRIRFSSYNDFVTWCEKRITAQALAELDRAIAELAIVHGRDFSDSAPVPELLKGLREQGYWQKEVFHDQSLFPLLRVDGKFESAVYGKLQVSDYPLHRVELPKKTIQKALIDKKPSLRLFALEYLYENPDGSLALSVLQAFEREDNLKFLPLYVKVLRQEPFWGKTPSAVPGSFVQKIKDFYDGSEQLSDKADAVYMALSYTNWQAPVNLDIFLYMVRSKWPLPFVRLVLQDFSDRGFLEFLSGVFEMGSSYDTSYLIDLFSFFPENPVCLKALYTALIKRDNDVFSPFAGQLIEVWEDITGLKYEGDDTVFKNWYADKN